MLRGFTLLEMLVTISVMSALLFFAAPNLYTYQKKQTIVRLASELQGFFVQAKSEAIFRNKDLWAHIELDRNPTISGRWTIRLTESQNVNSGETIQIMSGKNYRNILFGSNYPLNRVKFDGVRGKVNNGRLRFALASAPEKTLDLRSSFGASRIIVCGEGDSFYGYPRCG